MIDMIKRKNIIIMGAGGRDFHNFNVLFKNDKRYNVIAFTASQIPGIENRIYPPELSGKLYPNGIPILSERNIREIISRYKVDEVILSYSDLTYEDLMYKASLVLSSGADFRLLTPFKTMLKSKKTIIAVCASRTGAGKSSVSRYISKILRKRKLKYVIIRHPMPYGNLKKEIVQRFETFEDLDKYETTIEEREEYEPHLLMKNIVYSGIDYKKILKNAEKEADIIIWDGGNNDTPFLKPDLYITVVDPLRHDLGINSYPGTINVILADVIVINKVNLIDKKRIDDAVDRIRKINKSALIVKTNSVVSVDNPELIKNKQVLIVEDGPSLTHGGLKYGAGYIAAIKYNAKEIIDPMPYLNKKFRKIYEKYKIKNILPAIGYNRQQIQVLAEIINKVPADTVILGTPSDLSRIIKINKPVVKIKFEITEASKPGLSDVIDMFLKNNLK